MIKRWILKWIYKNIDIRNFDGFKEHAESIALLDERVNYLEEKQIE